MLQLQTGFAQQRGGIAQRLSLELLALACYRHHVARKQRYHRAGLQLPFREVHPEVSLALPAQHNHSVVNHHVLAQPFVQTACLERSLAVGAHFYILEFHIYSILL